MAPASISSVETEAASTLSGNFPHTGESAAGFDASFSRFRSPFFMIDDDVSQSEGSAAPTPSLSSAKPLLIIDDQ